MPLEPDDTGLIEARDFYAGQYAERCGQLAIAQSELTRLREMVDGLAKALERIQARASAHPSEDDSDRKRNLFHVESYARAALSAYAESLSAYLHSPSGDPK